MPEKEGKSRIKYLQISREAGTKSEKATGIKTETDRGSDEAVQGTTAPADSGDLKNTKLN